MLFNKLFQSFFELAPQVPVAGVILSMGLATCGLNPILASELETPATNSETVAAAKLPASDNTEAADNNQLQNGIYLYGETPQREQIGKEYVVFEARGGKVMGAFYMPASEYSCFYGTVKDNQLELRVANPENKTTYSHSIALERQSLVASKKSVGLQGYSPIGSLSAFDKKMLNVCQISMRNRN